MFLRDVVTTDDVGTKPGTSDISDTFVGSAGFVDFYSHTLPSFHVGINSNFTAVCQYLDFSHLNVNYKNIKYYTKLIKKTLYKIYAPVSGYLKWSESELFQVDA